MRRQRSAVTELSIPEPIYRYLCARVTHFFERRGHQAITDACAAVPGALPEATVMRLACGGPFGWLLDARLDRDDDGRYVLEVLEDSRMRARITARCTTTERAACW